MDAPTRTATWLSIERQRQPWYRHGARVIGRQFTAERQAYQQAFSQGETPAQGLAKVIAAIRRQEQPWEKLLTRLYRGVAEEFGASVLERIGTSPVPPRGPHPWTPLAIRATVAVMEQKQLSRTIRDWIREESAAKVQNILETTRRGIREILEEGIESGDTITEIAQMIGQFTGFSPARSLKIASSEIVNASNAAQTLELQQEEDRNIFKRWLSSRDAAVRDTHRVLDGQEVPLDEPYISPSGAQLRWPGDSGLGAPPEEVINCRCSQTFREI